MDFCYRATLYLGNLFEHYDTALYTFLSPLFASLFFPEGYYLDALIITLSFLPLGRIATPLGSLFFGYIGDVRGRGIALFYSLFGMATATSLIAFLPTYASVGVWAPFALLLIRILQNFFAAGEVIGGAVHLLEHCGTEKNKDLASSLWGTSTIAGILVASFFVSLLYRFDWVHTSWRALYLGGAVTALAGAFIRSRIAIARGPSDNISHFFQRLKIMWGMKKTFFSIAVAAGFSYSTYALAFTLMVSFVPLISDLNEADIMVTHTYLLVLDFFLLPLFGLLALRIPRAKSMVLSAMCACLVSLPLAMMLESPGFWVVLWVRMVIVVIGVWFSATFHSWAQDLVPKDYRYSTISVAYSIGSQLFGGTTPAISLWIYKQTGSIASITWYWALLALLTAYSIGRERGRESQAALSAS